MVRITLLSGVGFIVENNAIGCDDIPDVYWTLSAGSTTYKSRTTIKNDLQPL